LEDRGINGRMGSEWILRILSRGEGLWSGLSTLRIGAGGGLCEYGDEPTGSGAMELGTGIIVG
jgi:hypothetical protein